MYLVIVYLPIISSCLAGFFGRYLGSSGSSILTSVILFISFVLSFFVFFEVSLAKCFVYIKLNTWISSEIAHVDWGFMFDPLTACMCVIVTFISFLVHLYSTEYMFYDPHLPRFMSYLSLFTFFMLILVTSDNFVQLFVGWEGVGLCSYLLINFWFHWIQANKAAIKAMLLNRIGDFGLFLGIFVVILYFKSIDYATVAVLTSFFKESWVSFLGCDVYLLDLVAVLFLVGAVGKSAQLFLHTWLGDAMEGPTPVSALIHAATMVTAGIFLIIRSSFVYEQTTCILPLIILLGALTAFFAASVGLAQNDLKRVIAYSTASQLGYMMFALGLSNYSASFYHLTNHAFFKALLFLCAGSVIHAVHDEQDLRKLGGLKTLAPFTYSAMVIGSLALIGFPFLTGFYSKDFVLEVAYGKYLSISFFSYLLGSFSAFFTAFYSSRLIHLIFLSKPMGYRQILSYVSDSKFPICLALLSLIFPSIVTGFFNKEMFVGVGNDFFGTSIFTNFKNFNVFDAEFIPCFYKVLPVFLSLLGFISAFLLYSVKFELLFYLKFSSLGQKIYSFLNRKWFFDKIYNECLGQVFFKFSHSKSYKFLDRGIFEVLGPTGLSYQSLIVGWSVSRLQTNYIYHYMLLILLGIAFLFSFWEIVSSAHAFIDYRLFIFSLLLL